MKETEGRRDGTHVLLLPFPAQGHFNPMLQFGKRLASHGLRTTMAVTRFALKTTKPEPGPVAIKTFSDGFDEGGYDEAGSLKAHYAGLELVGCQTLEELILSEKVEGRPVEVLVYDAVFPWALDLGKRLGLVCAAFFTQSCAVDALCWHAWQGHINIPADSPVDSLPGLPRLKPFDLPSLLTEPIDGPYADLVGVLFNQFGNLDQADVVLVNSFYDLELEVEDWMRSKWNTMTIGPTVPSKFLDGRVAGDSHYGFHLWKPESESCMKWLDSKPLGSVVYVSFGSLATVGHEYMEELAQGLINSGNNFLWVVRQSEASKLPHNFAEETSEKGLVVSWSPQMQVLAHASVGCFVTHCGWNSTLEALSLGVPMVAVPQWVDQTTDAKFIQDVWKVGVRAWVDEKGLLRGEELERCIREVMEGDSGDHMRRNANKWRDLAKLAVSEGGSSDKNIQKFVTEYCL